MWDRKPGLGSFNMVIAEMGWANYVHLQAFPFSAGHLVSWQEGKAITKF